MRPRNGEKLGSIEDKTLCLSSKTAEEGKEARGAFGVTSVFRCAFVCSKIEDALEADAPWPDAYEETTIPRGTGAPSQLPRPRD